MKIASVLWLSLLLWSVPAAAQDKTAAAEKAAQRLAELLAPGAQVDNDTTRGPLLRPASSQVESPEVPLPFFKGTPPRLALPEPTPVKPRHLPEPAPLSQFRAEPIPPEA